MSTYNWKNGDSGNWGTPGDWQQDAVPNSTVANVTIASATGIGVTIAAGQSFTSDSVTLGSSAVTLDVAGLLNLEGSTDQLVLNTGTLNLEYGGTIANGTIVAGAVNFDGGTLANITYLGALNLSSDSDYINIEGELTLLNPGGGAGTINFVGYNEVFAVDNTATLNNVIINMDTSFDILAGDGGTLTLGSEATLNSDVPAADYFQFNLLDGNAVVNEGLINVVAGTLQIAPDSFSNFGSIDVSAGAYLFWDVSSTGNVGTIAGDGIVFLGNRYESGELTLANLADISLTGSGLVDLSGGVDLQGGTLAVSGNDNIAIGSFASIANGTINASLGARFGGSYRTQDGIGFDTLTNITWIGDLNVGSSFYKNGQSYTQPEDLNISGAFNLENASGSGPGTINIYDNSSLTFTEAHETLNNVGINLGSASQPVGFAEIRGNGGAGDALTFGKTTTINSYGYGNAGGTLRGNKIVNDGVININGEFWIDSATFVNAGTINFHAGSYLLDYRTRSLENTGLFECSGAGTEIANMPTKWVGGIIEVDAGNTLDLAGKLITDDKGTLILNGTGSEIEEKNGSGSAQGPYKKLETTLRTISSSGALEVLGGRGYTTSNTLEVDGTLTLGGGTFAAKALDIGPGGRFSGFGTIAVAVGNAGVIEAAGGTLVIGGPVTGVGGLQVDAASALELTTGTSENIYFAGAGSQLILQAPSLVTGTLSGIAAGDSIELVGDTAKSAAISGTNLLVTLTNNTVLDYTLASALPMEGVSISNGGGSAELTFYQSPAAAAAPEMRFMAPSAVPDKPAPPRPSSLRPLRELWSDATQYRPFFTGHFGRPSVTNLQHLSAELGNMPTPANAGIVLAALHNGNVAHILSRDLPFAPPKGFL